MRRNNFILFLLMFAFSLYAQSWVKLGGDFTYSTGTVPVLSVSTTGVPFVFYKESQSGLYANKYSVVKFENEVWNPIGGYGATISTLNQSALTIDKDLKLYIAYSLASGSKSWLMNYEVDSWKDIPRTNKRNCASPEHFFINSSMDTEINPVNVGAITFTEDNIFSSSITGLILRCDRENNLFVAYIDLANSNRVCVKKWDKLANKWNYVGNAFCSEGAASLITLSFDMQNRILIAFRDDALSGKLSVRRFNGNSWEYLGTRSFSSVVSGSLSMSVGGDNLPIVAYVNSNQAYKVTVTKYNGVDWISLGETISPGASSFVGIALGKNNTPYLNYRDNTQNYKSVIKKYIDGIWKDVGSNNILPEGSYTTNYNNIAVDSTRNIIYNAFTNNYRGQLWSFIDNITSVSTVHSSDNELFVNRNENRIVISNIEKGILSIYTITGTKIVGFETREPSFTTELKNGIYIIVNNGKVKKIVI
jgi:hypothetical protein